MSFTTPAPAYTPASKPHFFLPQGRTATEVAEVVGELFREGTLTWADLVAFSRHPEMGPLLTDTLGWAASRNSTLAPE